MSKYLKIHNGDIITPYKIIKSGTILIKGSKIIDIQAGDIDIPDCESIDAGGNYISPGFIDIHVHGGGGHDFMDGTADAFLKIAEAHARYGTTALSPTTLTSEKEDLFKTLDNYEAANKSNLKGAQFIGMHLEGPYFAMSQRGAQDPRYIRNPDPAEYEEILNYSKSISRWSAAPELKGAIEFGRYLKSKGILVALAHTDAIYEEALEAFENGYSLATHFYSSMSGVTRRDAYRYAGVVEAGYLIDEMDVEIIADGIHLPAPLLKLIYKIKGPDKTALITDAMRGAGMPEGDSILGSLKNGLKVIIEGGVAKLPDKSSFAGSVATFDRLVRNMITLADVPLIEAIRMAATTPARIMGIADKKGSLNLGKDADIVLFDKDINIQRTIIQGREVFNSQTS
ncbi:N-acetylglucosamine 6-phosphate deacetylase [Pseudopedobacter saltans DSM 12145]|uniref:N-acetylglucosamine 6-phosphate deacetylase n=1 Tax=Pseudopedobacter saltans (strain ATCC 51119 / DSM 12145 / JCM 21818 / CCUG 39354 / LMG 10337 / NBRC 100064 / NCIMB 13643) TaxID=762903 RepID=F0S882_PSESL|nr:N-acetylglucosamine-6-phosphate deacetylase [Pseudopedobacter saltans]ADY52344.1 N-acetylglucosamine 6-phosphate deacetylase [Pseudopedobacter saltans DSM 12145]